MSKSKDSKKIPLGASGWNLKSLTEKQIQELQAKWKQREEWVRGTSGHAFNAPREFLDIKINI